MLHVDVGKSNPSHVYSLRAVLLQGATVATALGEIVDDKLRFASHYAFYCYESLSPCFSYLKVLSMLGFFS